MHNGAKKNGAVTSLKTKFEKSDSSIHNATKMGPSIDTKGDSGLSTCDVNRTKYHFDNFNPKIWDEKKDIKTISKPKIPAPPIKVQFDTKKNQDQKKLKQEQEEASQRAIIEILKKEGMTTVLLNFK